MVETSELSTIVQDTEMRESDIFISYDFEDFAFSQKLQEAIREQKLQIWNNLLVGVSPHAPEAFQHREAGILNSTIFVSVISPVSIDSEVTRKELALAQQSNKHLILACSGVSRESLPAALLARAEYLTIDLEAATSNSPIADPFESVAKQINQTHICLRLWQRTQKWQQENCPFNLLLGKTDLKLIDSWGDQLITQRLQLQSEEQQAIKNYINASSEEANKQKARPLDVIISYSRKDKAFVEQLCSTLRDNNINFWVDWENIPVAAPWRVALAEGIRDARKFLFVMSGHSVVSKYCHDEIEQAFKFDKPMLGLLLRKDFKSKDVHQAIRDLEWLPNPADLMAQSLTENNSDFLETIKNELLEFIQNDEDHSKKHTDLLVAAMKWSGQEYKKEGQEYRWVESKRDPAILLQGKRLEEAKQWLEQGENKKPKPTQLHREFIQESIKARTRRRKRVCTGVAGGVAIIAGLSIAVVSVVSAKTEGQIRALVSSLEGKQQLDAVMVSLKAGQEFLEGPRRWPILNSLNPIRSTYSDVGAQVVTALNQSIYDLNESNRLEGHRGRVYTAIFNTNGFVASAGQDQLVKLWQPNGEEIKTFGGHTADVTTLDFAPDGKILASADYDGLVKLWNVEKVVKNPKDPGLIRTLTNPQGEPPVAVYRVRFSHDGQVLATASVDGTVKLWDATGKWLKTLRHGDNVQVNNVIFSQDDKMLVSASSDGVRLWNWNEQQPVAKKISDQPAVSMDWSPHNQQLTIAGYDATVRLWNQQDSKLIELKGHERRVRRVAFSHNGKLLASVGDDYTVRLWTPEGNPVFLKGRKPEEYVLRGHEAAVLRVLFSHDDKVLATSDDKGIIKLWRVEDGTLLDTFVGHRSGISDISLSDNATGQEKILSAGADGTVRLWRLKDDTIQPLSHENQVFDVLFSPDSQFAFSAGNGSIRVWRSDGSLVQQKLYDEDRSKQSAIPSFSIDRDGTLLASAGLEDGKVKLWSLDWKSNQPIDHLKDLPILSKMHYPVRAVSFSPDGQFLASGGDDQMVRLWNLDDSLNQILAGHREAVTSLAFSPNGKILASGSQVNQRGYVKGEIILWSVEEKRELLKIGSYPRPDQDKGQNDLLGDVLSVAFSPDGQFLAAADSEDNSIKIWQITSEPFNNRGIRVRPFKVLIGHTARVLKINYRSDGLLASASEDGTIRLWTAKGDPLTTLKKHQAKVNGIAFSKDKKILASVSDDRNVLLWRLPKELNTEALPTFLKLGCEVAKDYMETNRSSDPYLEREQRQIQKFCRRFPA